MARKRYRIRTIWDNMRQRCSDKNNRHFNATNHKGNIVEYEEMCKT